MSAEDIEEAASKREEAFKELLNICAAHDVSIPEAISSAILGDEDEEKGGLPEDTLLESEIAKNASHMSAIEEDELFLEFQKLWTSLKVSERKFQCKVIDGSYTVTLAAPEPSSTDGKGGPRRAKQKIKTVHSESPLTKLKKSMIKIITTCSLKEETVEKCIMKGVNLELKSGKLYLVLGAPGSGKSTLLKMIANTLRQDKKNVLEGDVIINGLKASDKNVVWQNLTAHIDQIDRLHKYLTVLETCTFAWQCRSGGTHARDFFDMDDPEVVKVVEQMNEDLYTVHAVLRGMGLARVNDTFVGDNVSVRGVSGGEKKRVTVSELMCIGVPVLCCDEISTGLDAATTFDIVKLLGATSRLTNTIKVVSLLQPPPETVALFDELILIDSGRVIYSGPVVEVVPHFESLGYEIPERMDPADWLQALPTRDGALFRVDKDKAHLDTDDFVQKFISSERGHSLLTTVKEEVEEDEELLSDLARTKFKNPWYRSLKLLIQREMLLWWRDKYSIKARVLQDLIMGIVAGTVFWQQWENPQSVMGILYQSMFFISLGSMLRVPEQFDLRGILYKQQDANFFPTWTFVVGRSLAGVPTAVIDAGVYGIIIYWFVGLAYNEGASIANFFIFLMLVFVASLASGLIFSIFSSMVADRPTGQAAMSIAIIVLVLFSGFTVQPDVIPDYWIWVYWMNMFAWVLRSLAINEYQSGKYSDEVAPGVTQGDAILEQFGFTLNGERFGFEWVRYGFAFAIGISIVSAGLSIFFLNNLRYDTGLTLATELKEDADDEDNAEPKEEVNLPFQKVNLTFRDIHYTVTSSITNEKLELLQGVDGYLEAGKMTALMGSSGAGKTTLMDVLSLRKTSGEITGEIRLNGHFQEPLSFRRCTGYVEQFDVQSPQLTIRETVEFSAALRLEESDEAVTPESRIKFVEQTLEMLELTEIQDLQVGSDLTGGLSFEQNKRLAIAVELVANPSIIFLDEPTSGLDARAASIVMRGLKRIADGGRAVCATIHQPSVAIFTSFDSLLLLKRGGETVYFGELGESSAKLINYLERYPSTKKIHAGENPATWMLTTIGAGSSSTGQKPFDYADSFASSKLREDALAKIDKFDASATEDNEILFPRKYASSSKAQLKAVMSRTRKIYWRSPTYNLVRMLVAIIVSLLFGSVYISQRVPTTEGDMNSRVTTIFITTLFLAVNAYNTVLSVFETERNMFYRHKAALMYDSRAPLIAFSVTEIPFILMSSALFVIPFYFMVGFESDASKFFLYYLFFTLNSGLFTFLGQMMVSLTKNSQVAQGFGGVIIGMTSLFSGLLIRPQDINGFWTWAYWTFPGHYVLEGLVTSQFHNDDTPITPSVGSEFYEAVLQTPKCQALDDTRACTGTSELWVEISFGGEFQYDNIPGDLAYLVVAIILSKVVTSFALTKLNFLAK